MSYRNPRIELTDTPMSAIVKITDGNPGAVSVLMRLFSEGAAIDPDSAFGGFGSLLSLDTLDIYGHRVWQFYKDVSGSDLITMMGLMRATQLGMLPESELLAAVNGKRMPDDWASGYVAKVRERLPAFGKVTA